MGKKIRLITPPGDGFHGCGLNARDLIEESVGTGRFFYNAYRDYKDNYIKGKRIRRNGGLAKFADGAENMIKSLFS